MLDPAPDCVAELLRVRRSERPFKDRIDDRVVSGGNAAYRAGEVTVALTLRDDRRAGWPDVLAPSGTVAWTLRDDRRASWGDDLAPSSPVG